MAKPELIRSVSKLQEHDQVAELMKRFHPAVHRRAQRILRDEEDAADVAQEVFLRAMRLCEGAVLPHPRAWLFRVTTNLCLNWLRASRRRDALISEVTALRGDEHAREAGSAAALEGLLRDVPAELLSPAVYYYVEDLSHAEIAAKLGVSRRTVGNRLVAFHASVRKSECAARVSGDSCLAVESLRNV